MELHSILHKRKQNKFKFVDNFVLLIKSKRKSSSMQTQSGASPDTSSMVKRKVTFNERVSVRLVASYKECLSIRRRNNMWYTSAELNKIQREYKHEVFYHTYNDIKAAYKKTTPSAGQKLPSSATPYTQTRTMRSNQMRMRTMRSNQMRMRTGHPIRVN